MLNDTLIILFRVPGSDLDINHKPAVMSLFERVRFGFLYFDRVLSDWSLLNRFSRGYFGIYESHFWVDVTEEVTTVPHFAFYGHFFLRFR